LPCLKQNSSFKAGFAEALDRLKEKKANANRFLRQTLNNYIHNYESLNLFPVKRKLGSKMEKSLSNLKQKIISYLCTYGNTKETDLINYGVQRLGISEANMVKLIDEMASSGRIERILHKELEPAVTYVKQGSLVTFGLKLQAISDSLELGEITNQQIEEIKEILDKAKAIAKKRMKRKINAID